MDKNNIILNTPRFQLRNWKLTDKESLVKAANNINVARFMVDSFPSPYTINDAINRINDNLEMDEYTCNLAIVEDNIAIWWIGFIKKTWNNRMTWYIWFWIGEDYWWKWIIKESLVVFIDFIFKTYDIVRLEIPIFSWNIQCQKLVEKFWFKHEATLKKHFIKNWEYFDELIYVIFKDEYLDER